MSKARPTPQSWFWYCSCILRLGLRLGVVLVYWGLAADFFLDLGLPLAQKCRFSFLTFLKYLVSHFSLGSFCLLHFKVTIIGRKLVLFFIVCVLLLFMCIQSWLWSCRPKDNLGLCLGVLSCKTKTKPILLITKQNR